jgi:CO/xanthine dehydrogenase Mo-binding subunit
LRGEARYVADVRLPGLLAIAFVRSTVSHGILVGIDSSAAEESPGVEAVFTARDLEASLGTVPRIPPRVSFDETVVPYLQPLLATDKVRYVGEPLAVVVASDRYAAEDAADQVFADIEPLDPSLGEMDKGEPIHAAGNLITSLVGEYGDAASAIARADIVVEAELSIGRHSAVPMETRGISVEYDPDSGHLTVHGATKVPHWNRNATCELLGIAPSRLTMRETAVGGGFGVRGELYPEDVLAVWVADRLRRSVSWIEDRREHLMAANHSREQRHRAVIAGDRSGRITALASEFSMDMGAYVRTHSVRVADLTLSMLPGPYDIANYRAVGHCVATNKTPTGTYRGPGRFESSFVRERLVDLFAEKAGMDPVEIRLSNLIKPDQIPYERPLSSTGEPMVFGEGDFPRMLDLVVETLDADAVEQRRLSGEAVGTGIAMFLEKSGLGPWETGSIEVDPRGVVSVRSGCSSVGQGIRTALAQIVADELEIEVDLVRVELLDTDSTENGIGSYASRSTVTAGSALVEASREIIETVKKVASVALEVDPADLEYREGSVRVRGSPESSVTIFEAASKLTPEGALQYGRERPGLSADSVFNIERVAYPCGAQGAVARVDRETGVVTVEKLVLCYDIGRAVNPMLVMGQMEGGAIQAMGGTLLESFAYDDGGNPVATTFMDYLLPTMAETPTLVAVPSETSATETNPLGIKGAGEGGIPGVAAAIASAVDSALGRPGAVTSVPIRPEQLT